MEYSTEKVQARAKVMVNLEITCDPLWGSDFTLKQIQNEAARSALADFDNLLRKQIHFKGIISSRYLDILR